MISMLKVEEAGLISRLANKGPVGKHLEGPSIFLLFDFFHVCPQSGDRWTHSCNCWIYEDAVRQVQASAPTTHWCPKASQLSVYHRHSPNPSLEGHHSQTGRSRPASQVRDKASLARPQFWELDPNLPFHEAWGGQGQVDDRASTLQLCLDQVRFSPQTRVPQNCIGLGNHHDMAHWISHALSQTCTSQKDLLKDE